MKITLAILLLAAAGCKHPLDSDWTRVVDMNNGRELYEAQKVESYLNAK